MSKHTAEQCVAYWVRRYRKERNIRQGDLADRISITRCSVNNWEKLRSPISIEYLEAISKVLGVHIALFFQDIPDQLPTESNGTTN